ncbi:MAG: SH3 domain-containing protein [Firmicutes bacterium]|nr:SH3 domain-containing protein [Bacillota bacterium]NLL87638.1 SH3 domain-containing protein [Bacillota bacterium]
MTRVRKIGMIIMVVALFLLWTRQNPPYPDLGQPDDLKLMPVDQAYHVPDFAEFRTAMIKAMEQKDLDFVLNCIDDTLRYTFGLNQGVKGFLRYWELDTMPEDSPFWEEMLQVLRLGGEFADPDQKIFRAPYVFSSFPETLDAFQHVAVVGQNVKVYADPEFSAQVIGILSYSIVRHVPYNDKYEFFSDGAYWRKVATSSGKTGFVPDKYLRSPVDYRASFAKSNGKWQLIFFVAGD